MEEILVFTAKLNWNTHFKTIVYYVQCNLAPTSMLPFCLQDSLNPCPLCPHFPFPCLLVFSKRKQRQPLCDLFFVTAD
jgi:hypothetical protein